MISLTPLQPAAPVDGEAAVRVVRTILRCAWDRPETGRNLTSLTKR